ncbi:hypothetical protein G6011_07540 [Alternaria panax]|uniref:Uncharacterized protein n=1 Tax=Alternaria panax TaxID=48097 RepID=A0AAD4I4T5_9PLEO|nr:hypothetical protein G6011_07540 [Alternaria panax]
MNFSATSSVPNFILFFMTMVHFYVPALSFSITTNVLLEPHNSHQELVRRNATTEPSTSVVSNQSLWNIIPPIVLGILGGIFAVGRFIVAVKQYRRSDTSRLEKLIMQTRKSLLEKQPRF